MNHELMDINDTLQTSHLIHQVIYIRTYAKFISKYFSVTYMV